MAKKIDWTQITVHSAQGRRHQAALEQLELVGTDFEITDALSHKADGGLLLLQIINGNVNGANTGRGGAAEQAYQKRYHLRTLRNQDGHRPTPGDVIEWRMGRRLRDALGRKITTKTIRDLERRGEIRTIETWHSATVDEHGCITVSFEDACMLLDTRGVHYVSGGPLTGMKERSGSRHFWLYAEVPEEEYEKLDSSPASTNTTEKKK